MRSILLLAFCIQAVWATASVEQTLNAAGVTEITIENMRGLVVVSGNESEQISVRGTLDEVAEGFIFERRGNTVVAIVEMPQSRQLRGRKGSDLQFSIPQSLFVRFKGVSSDIVVEKVTAGIELSTVSGDVEVRQVTGDQDLDSVSGSITIRESRGRLMASNVSGDVSAELVSDDIQVSVISGNAELKSEGVKRAVVSTVSGDVELALKLSESPFVKVTTVTGEASLYSLNTLNAEIRLQTGPGGDIVNRFNDLLVTSSFVKEKALEFSVGTGAGKVQMNTVSGTLMIK